MPSIPPAKFLLVLTFDCPQVAHTINRMCTLYRSRHGSAEIARLFGAVQSQRNDAPTGDIYPDALAPVVRNAPDSSREIIEMRWGFPPPPNVGNAPVVNVRNTASPFWRAWLKPEQRCLVPVSSFCEWTDSTPKQKRWFAMEDDEPLFAFAGIWRPWSGTRGTKKSPVEGDHLLFSFLTCEPNDVVRPIHAKAMPVILVTAEDRDTWMNAPVEVALTLQRPFGEGLKLVD